MKAEAVKTWPLLLSILIRVINGPYYGKEGIKMDELKLMLSSRFMKGIVTKIISKAIYKKSGYQVDIQINEIKAEISDGKVRIHIDADGEMKSSDLVEILKSKDIL